MSRNRSRGTRSSLRVRPMMLSSELIAEILRMQRFPVGRTRRYAVVSRGTLHNNMQSLTVVGSLCHVGFLQQPHYWQTLGQCWALCRWGSEARPNASLAISACSCRFCRLTVTYSRQVFELSCTLETTTKRRTRSHRHSLHTLTGTLISNV